MCKNNGMEEACVNWGVVAALVTAFAAVVAAFTAVLAYRAIAVGRDGVLATRDSITAGLILQLSKDYTEMHSALRILGGHQRRSKYKSLDELQDAYVSAVKPVGSGDFEWDDARRRVSKFFLTAKNLCTAGLIEEAVLARAIERDGFEL